MSAKKKSGEEDMSSTRGTSECRSCSGRGRVFEQCDVYNRRGSERCSLPIGHNPALGHSSDRIPDAMKHLIWAHLPTEEQVSESK